MTQEQSNFIKSIYDALVKYAPSYNIKCYSGIIAQAINESGWGKSTLASKYHNYFGMKCGSYWNGKSVNMQTQEEYTPGTLTTINDNFRVYDSLEDGVVGYLQFINTPRYSNLKGVTNVQEYLTNIKNDGYATSSTYVTNLLHLVDIYSLTQYDGEQAPVVQTRNIGDVIKLRPGCTYYNGQKIPSWVFNCTLYYRGKNSNGVIFSRLKTGDITGVVSENDIL